jgi:hypothetical protein
MIEQFGGMEQRQQWTGPSSTVLLAGYEDDDGLVAYVRVAVAR